MENDFYATIKLKTGEEIFTRIAVTDEEENSLLIHSPVKVSEIISKSGQTGGYKLESWIKTADDDMFIIRMEDILTMSETRDLKMITMHQSFVNRYSRMKNQKDGFTPNRNHGYISNVNDARKLLEKIFKQKSSEL
jgi:hypothetical protein